MAHSNCHALSCNEIINAVNHSDSCFWMHKSFSRSAVAFRPSLWHYGKKYYPGQKILRFVFFADK